ncbi:MAG TPA: DOMON-like domain-containing protein [Candidatus Deferrimicrobiaceae bacterium]
MMILPFSLVPFPGQAFPPGLAVEGTLGRHEETLVFCPSISGDLSMLEIPPATGRPERRDGLWEETCLELFLGESGSESYLEFNLSPSGNWNVYRFDVYRKGMREEAAFDALPFQVDREKGRLALSVELDLGKLFPPGRPLSAAVAAVVRTVSGEKSCWALAHTSPRPDFHQRDAFRIRFPASP